MRYTIEARELIREFSERPSADGRTRHAVVEANDADEAITLFIRENDSELVSLIQPLQGRESIATVRKDDSVFLLRVYSA